MLKYTGGINGATNRPVARRTQLIEAKNGCALMASVPPSSSDPNRCFGSATNNCHMYNYNRYQTGRRTNTIIRSTQNIAPI